MAAGARDPREFYRERLRALRGEDPAAYREAVDYYENTLVPTVADPSSDPVAAWTDYGRRLAELAAEGRTVEIDASGRAVPFESPASPGALILHIPDGKGRAILVGLPTELSAAQRATYDWLVGGRKKLRSS